MFFYYPFRLSCCLLYCQFVSFSLLFRFPNSLLTLLFLSIVWFANYSFFLLLPWSFCFPSLSLAYSISLLFSSSSVSFFALSFIFSLRLPPYSCLLLIYTVLSMSCLLVYLYFVLIFSLVFFVLSLSCFVFFLLLDFFIPSFFLATHYSFAYLFLFIVAFLCSALYLDYFSFSFLLSDPCFFSVMSFSSLASFLIPLSAIVLASFPFLFLLVLIFFSSSALFFLLVLSSSFASSSLFCSRAFLCVIPFAIPH